ncbi:MAG: BREX-1 system adenine-specific DNA-methyltransferase PglX, partial [Coprothermobacterota bacterium]|nr:BREX-1 system adenine-specific DNA-methyltransferase PglX [Coprothermobacterota bacterium]
MNTDLIRRFTLKARQLLTQEVGDLLEGVYGLRSDGAFEPTRNLPALLELPEAGKTRKQLERFLEDEESASLSRRDAYTKLLKETAFTHLNRLVAFKMMEARGLRRGVLDKHQDSNEFLFYLADATHAGDYGLYQQGSFPQDALGEGPRDRAYRHFLLWLCGETAQEIMVLFVPGNLPSRLFPRPRVLQDLLALLNDPALAEAWQPGNEETIGWVYQYYNEEEKRSVFDRLFKQKQKIRVEDIPAATQLFTPRWIVEFLVQNSLGRLWLEMHPDSSLREQLGYLIPPAQIPAPRPMKLVRELTFLDPACGTMHFGLVAFDLFHAMYREEFQRAGTPNWPQDPSVRSKEEIPGAIIAFNLHGIDIDLRAVQLSALTLYLKAKSVNPNVRFIDSHLACADVLLLNGPRLESFLAEKGKGRPVFARICQALWPALRDARQMGSLVRLEQTVRQVIEKARIEYESASLFPDPGRFADHYRNPLVFWGSLENEILNALDQFAREKGDLLGDQALFSGEATKGIRVLDLMLRSYDVVCTNPPYLSNGNMNAIMSAFLKEAYPRTKGDLYTAFIERSTELLREGGHLGMITQQSFMFLSSYAQLRGQLRETITIESMLHVGPRAFAEISGEKVNTTLFVLRREADVNKRGEAVGTYFRLVKEPDAQAKRVAFERAVAHARQMTPQENEAWQEGVCPSDGRVFRYRQGDFDAIPGSPWVYWITPGLRRLFKDLPKLKDIAEPRVGLQTSDNFRFLRFWWEMGSGNIERFCKSQEECAISAKIWFPYMKGGSYLRWFGNQEYCINYGKNGHELKAWATPLYDNSGWSRIIKSPDFYFRRGVTWSRITSGRLSVRISPGGFIFADAGCSAFPSKIDSYAFLGIMNSQIISV